MDEINIYQDNRLTSAKYDLSLIEKRVLYQIILKVKTEYKNDSLDRTLFKDLLIHFESNELVNDSCSNNKGKVKKGLKDLRLRSFEYVDEKGVWYECGFINRAKWDKGIVEVQVSEFLLPFLVDLSREFTQFNMLTAISLKSRWSQRLFEIINQYKNLGGVNFPIEKFREILGLEDKYTKFSILRQRVLDTAYKEIKSLYDANQSDIYFEYSETVGSRQKITNIVFKIITRGERKQLKNTDNYSNADVWGWLTVVLQCGEGMKKPGNKTTLDKVMKFLKNNEHKTADLVDLKKRVNNKFTPEQEEQRGAYVMGVLQKEFMYRTDKKIKNKEVKDLFSGVANKLKTK